MSEIKTEKAFVAFIDLLGGSELIENDPDGSLNVIHDCYESVIKFIYERDREPLFSTVKSLYPEQNFVYSIGRAWADAHLSLYSFQELMVSQVVNKM